MVRGIGPLLVLAFREVAPVTQYQLVQHDIRNIEMRLVIERKLTSREEKGCVTSS